MLVAALSALHRNQREAGSMVKHRRARAKKSQLVGFNLPNLRWNWVKRHVRGEKILDIGFAHQSSEIPRDKSYHSMIAAQSKGSLVVGLDIDSEVVHEVKQRYPVEYAIVADATFLPFRDNSFDTVFMGDVIEHVWEPLLLLQEVYRLMKVQGRLFLTTPNLLDFARVLRYMVRGVIGGLNDEPGHCRFYDKVSLNRLLEHAGFIVIYCEAWKFRVPFFGRYLKFNLHTPPFSNCGLHLLVSAIKTSIHRSYEYML